MSSQINLKSVAPPAVTAAIFDMDDLMIDSHPLDMDVFAIVLKGHGVDIHNLDTRWTVDDEISMFGLKLPDTFKLFIDKYGLSSAADPETMSNEFYEKMLTLLEEKPLGPMPGLLDLVANLRDAGLVLAVASSARRKKIDIVLRKLDLQGAFTAIVSGEDEIEHGKPAPDIFLAAAQKIGKVPAACMVFEDAKNGVASINAAGMFSVGVHNQFSEKTLGIRQDLSAANLQVDSLAQLTYR